MKAQMFMCDTTEAHSYIDNSTSNEFLSRTQLLMINQMQDVSTWRSLSYRDPGQYAVDEDLQVETFCI